MIQTISHRWRLFRLRLVLWKVENSFQKEKRKAKMAGESSEQLSEIDDRQWFECSLIQDEISRERSRRLWRQAFKYDIPELDLEGWWEASKIGGRQLTRKGFHELGAAIRKEKNERWSYWQLRLNFIIALATAVTGVTGALIGLAAILKD